MNGLASAYAALGDPATERPIAAGAAVQAGPWKLHSIKAEGFGGVNAWKGAPFELELEGSSILLEGPNGSGKSSLTAAIVWALSGERPRDQAEAASEELKPVFGIANTKAGDWPPIATYPIELIETNFEPSVSVELNFTNPAGAKAAVRRAYDGKKMTHVVDPQLNIPPTLLEAGLLMPSRLPKLRFDEGRGRLTDAVQTLTGLDHLIELGAFIQGLCHGGRDYLSYKKSELETAQAAFDKQIETANAKLAAVNVVVPDFKIADTDDAKGAMAMFGKMQIDRAAALTQVVSDDLAAGLDLANEQVQKQVVVALSGAEADLDSGLVGLQEWKSFESVASALPVKVREGLAQATARAQTALAAALEFHNKAQSDTRYRLKASAARWHAEHGGGAIDECPTCQHSIKDRPDLQAELAELQSAGEAATRKFSDNIVGIMAELEAAVPQTMRRYLSEDASSEPRAKLVKAFADAFVEANHYQKYLVRAGALSSGLIPTFGTLGFARR